MAKKRRKVTKQAHSAQVKRYGDAQGQAPAAQPEASPYGLQQNRKCKHAVLGERVRGARRKSVKSRATAVADRTNSLLKECLTAGRTSNFKDARLGEQGKSEQPEARAVQRLVKLRQKQARKSFALDGAGAEDLMHGGKRVSTLADDDLRDDSGLPDADPDCGDIVGGPEDVIAQFKIRKAATAKEREAHDRQLNDFDADYSSILGSLKFRAPKTVLAESVGKANSDGDAYDQLVRQLSLDRKVSASERTKAPEELALERALELESLERARAARASGLAEDPADEADENAQRGQQGKDAAVESSDEEDEGEAEADEDAESGEGSDDDGDQREDEDSDGEGDDGGVGGRNCEGEDDEDDARGRGSVLHLLPLDEAAAVNIMENDASTEKGLPYAPDCPSSMKGVESLLGSHLPKSALKIVERVRARTARTLAPANSGKLRVFLIALLDYALHVMARKDGDLSARGVEMVFALRLPLVQLAREYADDTCSYFTEKLQSMGPATLPRAAEFACLKLIALLFPVTDFQHPVCTPAALLADHWASQLAALGAGLGDLVSDALFLWELLYHFLRPACRFCASFYQLGVALLESCLALAAGGRAQCFETAEAIAALLVQALQGFCDVDGAAASMIAQELVRPGLRTIRASHSWTGSPLQERFEVLMGQLDAVCANVDADGANVEADGAKVDADSARRRAVMRPLMLFQAPPAQIKTFEPIFHDVGATRNMLRGMEVTEMQQLTRKANRERRAAMRQLSSDAAVLQRLQNRKDTQFRTARKRERARVTSLMEEEAQMLRKLKTENTTSMDTSLRRFSTSKDRKRAQPRLAGDATATPEPKGGDEGEQQERHGKAKATPRGRAGEARQSKKKVKGGKGGTGGKQRRSA